MSNITLVFDKINNHPIDPGQVNVGTESIFSTKVSNGDYLTDLSIGPKTVSFTLEGVPEGLANQLENLVANYVAAAVDGRTPGTNVSVDGVNYYVTSVNKGAGVLLNGRRIYQNVEVTAKTTELTVSS